MSARRQRSNRNQGSRNTSIISGKVSSQKLYTFTAGKWEVPINDQLNYVTASLGQVYRLFRYKRIKVTIFPSSADNYLVGYIPGAPITAGTYADFCSTHMTAVSISCSVPMSFTIGEEALTTDHRWFVTQGDATEESSENVGSLVGLAQTASSNGVLVLMELDFEFKAVADAASITALTNARAKGCTTSKTSPGSCNCSSCGPPRV